MYRDRIAEIDESSRFARASLKETVLRAITRNELSVAKAAELSGWDRRTIKIWLDLFNLEQKYQQK